ncbi:hypothetical protein MTO96_017520 [Rhipicephalus appendiculatus]
MGTAYAIAFFAALCGTNVIVSAKLGAPGGPLKLAYEVPDSFEAFSNFPFSVAISDSDNDTIFECVVANRTEIDPESRTATFVWHFLETDHSPEQYIPFYGKAGSSPGTMEVTVGDDPTVLDGIFYYSTKECVVMDLEYHGHQCLLWTSGYSRIPCRSTALITSWTPVVSYLRRTAETSAPMEKGTTRSAGPESGLRDTEGAPKVSEAVMTRCPTLEQANL